MNTELKIIELKASLFDIRNKAEKLEAEYKSGIALIQAIEKEASDKRQNSNEKGVS